MSAHNPIARAATAAAFQIHDTRPSVSLVVQDLQQCYTFGDTLSGQVCVKLREACSVGKLQLGFRGDVTINGLTGTRKEGLIHLQHYLWSADASHPSTDVGDIPAGTHMWPFTLTIPLHMTRVDGTECGTIPPTFQGDDLSVRYMLSAVLEVEVDGVVQEGSVAGGTRQDVEIRVHNPGSAMDTPLQRRMWRETGSLASEEGREAVDVTASVPRLGFRPKDLLELSVHMPEKFGWLRVSLQRTVSLPHQGMVYTDTTTLGKADIPNPVAGSHRLVVRVPDGVTPSSALAAVDSGSPTVRYALRVDVESRGLESWWSWAAGAKRVLTFEVPVVIGQGLPPPVRPVSGYPLEEDESLPLYTAKDINAPPPYLPLCELGSV